MLFLLKLIYILSVQICATCFICAIFSTNKKLKKKFPEEYDIYAELTKKDIGEKAIILMKVIFMCIIPILNTILGIGFTWKWEEIRDNAYEQQKRIINNYIDEHPTKFYSKH